LQEEWGWVEMAAISTPTDIHPTPPATDTDGSHLQYGTPLLLQQIQQSSTESRGAPEPADSAAQHSAPAGATGALHTHG